MGRALIWITNLALIVFLTARLTVSNDDKSTIVFIFFYSVIIGANLFLWMIFGLTKSKLENEMTRVMIGLVIIFIPLYFFVSSID